MSYTIRLPRHVSCTVESHIVFSQKNKDSKKPYILQRYFPLSGRRCPRRCVLPRGRRIDLCLRAFVGTKAGKRGEQPVQPTTAGDEQQPIIHHTRRLNGNHEQSG